MRGFSVAWGLFAAVLLLAGSANLAHAQYWFQSGATGTYTSAQNQGASVAIQTIYQNISDGSLGFWVGESLSNGAFIQAGYEITNNSGDFPTSCTPTGCSGATFVTAGKPTWFWEYFPAKDPGQSFYGSIGQDGSAGANGTYHNYAFQSSGNTWTVYFDNQTVGSVNLGTSASGANPPSAFAEVADTSSNMQKLAQVYFKNLKFYDGSSFKYVPNAMSYTGYGKGSLESLSNPYGVQEVNNQINYFVVGSGIPVQTNARLWSLGYGLQIQSQYGNLTRSVNYTAYSNLQIGAPAAVNVSSGTREVFAGWSGTGTGSYTGDQNNVTITMNGNIQENALWQRQYYVGAGSSYGSVAGTGWYDANSSVELSLNATKINTGYGRRVVFDHWSSGGTAPELRLVAAMPTDVMLYWDTQYMVNATTAYGNTTGSGWYDANSTARITLGTEFVPIGNGTRLGFKEWSNGNSTRNITISAGGPTFISAIYGRQYMVVPVAQDAYGDRLQGSVYYNISGALVGANGTYLFANQSYNIQYIDYKGAQVLVNRAIAPATSGMLYFNTQVFNVNITARSLVGTPLNASVELSFKNGSAYKGYAGSTGRLSFSQVPYGYVNGTAKYFGVAEGVSAQGGQNVYLSFFTPLVIAIVIAGILIIVASWRISLEIHRRKGLV
ncbi:MAG: hypothetical protein KGH66_01860 [Candidatus Micrarchaeota archaeon]|nr:hypothetical protein [Candidatus Micrarchaeota archaeon]